MDGFDAQAFHYKNFERASTAFYPTHGLVALAACVGEELGELTEAIENATSAEGHARGREVHVADAIADAWTYLSLTLWQAGEKDLEQVMNDSKLDDRIVVYVEDATDSGELVKRLWVDYGRLCAACLGVSGEKARKSHLQPKDIVKHVRDMFTWFRLLAPKWGVKDLEQLLVDTFNMVSDRCGSPIKV